MGGEDAHRVSRVLDLHGAVRRPTPRNDHLWFDGAFWFGTGSQTQKARNLAKNPNCIVGTQNAAEAVILEGVAEIVTDADLRRKLEPASLRKYGMSGGDGSEPVYRVRPQRAFGLVEKTFPKTATRWTFE
jgi:hypothetical protein